MPILSPDNVLDWAPDVTATGFALVAAIRLAQSLAEGPRGANRPLELRQYKETKRLGRDSQTAIFSYFPALEMPAPLVEVRRRSSVSLEYGRVAGPSDWLPLEQLDSVIDFEFGRLNLYSGSYAVHLPGYDGPGVSSRSKQWTWDECRITYSSGFDFATDTSPEADEIRAVVGQILTFQQGGGLNLSSYKSGEEQVQYRSQGDALESFLETLQKWKPRMAP